MTWPEQEDLRHDLASDGVLRVLVLETATAPPRLLDSREDWIRAPFEPGDLEARVAALVRRADCGTERPVLDTSGLLWFHERWVAIPDAQIAAVELLVDHLGHVVSTDDLEAASVHHGASANAIAMKSLLRRVANRVQELGLELRTVRRRGYLLDAPHTCRLHPLPGDPRPRPSPPSNDRTSLITPSCHFSNKNLTET